MGLAIRPNCPVLLLQQASKSSREFPQGLPTVSESFQEFPFLSPENETCEAFLANRACARSSRRCHARGWGHPGAAGPGTAKTTASVHHQGAWIPAFARMTATETLRSRSKTKASRERPGCAILADAPLRHSLRPCDLFVAEAFAQPLRNARRPRRSEESLRRPPLARPLLVHAFLVRHRIVDLGLFTVAWIPPAGRHVF